MESVVRRPALQPSCQSIKCQTLQVELKCCSYPGPIFLPAGYKFISAPFCTRHTGADAPDPTSCPGPQGVPYAGEYIHDN